MLTIGCRARDVPLAYKTFLRAVEISTDPSNTTLQKHTSSGISEKESLEGLLNGSDMMTRLWWWLKIVGLSIFCGQDEDFVVHRYTHSFDFFYHFSFFQCTLQLLSPSYTPPSTSQTPSIEHVSAIDSLVDEKLTELIGNDGMTRGVRGLEEVLR